MAVVFPGWWTPEVKVVVVGGLMGHCKPVVLRMQLTGTSSAKQSVALTVACENYLDLGEFGQAIEQHLWTALKQF